MLAGIHINHATLHWQIPSAAHNPNSLAGSSYSSTPMQGVTFEVRSGESVGIVGRTGSGKSSLIVALFRLAEPYQGAIMLDGHNLLELGLQVVTTP